MLYHVQHLANELAFGLVDAKGVEFRKLRGVGKRQGEDNGLLTVAAEEGTVHEHNVHGYEIMVVVFGMAGLQFGKRAESIDGDDGHDILQH